MISEVSIVFCRLLILPWKCGGTMINLKILYDTIIFLLATLGDGYSPLMKY